MLSLKVKKIPGLRQDNFITINEPPLVAQKNEQLNQMVSPKHRKVVSQFKKNVAPHPESQKSVV